MINQKINKTYPRKRPYVISFRASKEEFAKINVRFLLSGLTSKNQFFLMKMFNQEIKASFGKFSVNRLCLEIKKLSDALYDVKVSSDVEDLLLECRELVGQLISLQNKVID